MSKRAWMLEGWTHEDENGRTLFSISIFSMGETHREREREHNLTDFPGIVSPGEAKHEDL